MKRPHLWLASGHRARVSAVTLRRLIFLPPSLGSHLTITTTTTNMAHAVAWQSTRGGKTVMWRLSWTQL